MLRFQEEDHKYIWTDRNGAREVPSVTQILKHAGINDVSNVPQSALDRGKRIHSAIADAFKMGFTDQSFQDDELKYYSSAMLFISEHQVKVIKYEQPIFSIYGNYAGTIDLVCRIDGVIWLLDWKLNDIYPGTFVQLAGYAHLWNENNRRYMIEKRGAVRLTTEGYQLVDAEGIERKFQHQNDYPKFLNALKGYYGGVK